MLDFTKVVAVVLVILSQLIAGYFIIVLSLAAADYITLEEKLYYLNLVKPSILATLICIGFLLLIQSDE